MINFLFFSFHAPELRCAQIRGRDGPGGGTTAELDSGRTAAELATTTAGWRAEHLHSAVAVQCLKEGKRRFAAGYSANWAGGNMISSFNHE